MRIFKIYKKNYFYNLLILLAFTISLNVILVFTILNYRKHFFKKKRALIFFAIGISEHKTVIRLGFRFIFYPYILIFFFMLSLKMYL